jgi:hypothetical protein
MAKPIGNKINALEKCIVGITLMLFVIGLIAGPMLLFSNINPISKPNPVS